MKKGKKGFTLVEIMIVVAIIGLLAAIAIPSFMRARTSSQRNACINNMRQIEAGKDQYALETGRTNLWNWANDTAAFSNLTDTAEGYIKMLPLCPASTSAHYLAAIAANDYQVSAIGSNALCETLHAADAHAMPGTF